MADILLKAKVIGILQKGLPQGDIEHINDNWELDDWDSVITETLIEQDVEANHKAEARKAKPAKKK